MQDIGTQFHIRCNPEEVGRYCFLPGDPGRCEAIAAHFDDPVHIGMNREYNIYTGTLLGEKVSVCSTGIGRLLWKSCIISVWTPLSALVHAAVLPWMCCPVM